MSKYCSKNLYDAFSDVARDHPTRRAVVSGSVSLSYSELSQQIDVLCRSLREAGILPGERVAVVLPNSAEFVVATLGIWQMGAVVVPFHVNSHEKELARSIVDCEAHIVLSTNQATSSMKALRRRDLGIRSAMLYSSEQSGWMPLGEADPTGKPERERDAYPAVDPQSVALIQYSTGSTGQPKRVARSHWQLVDQFETVSSVLGITKHDRILAAVPLCHSYGFMNAMIHGFLSGAALFVLKDFFVRDVVRLIEKEKITIFPGVPFMYQQLAEFNGKADLSSLRWARSAGAHLTKDISKSIRNKYGLSVYQQYGSTETGTISLSSIPSVETTPGAMGGAIPGVTLTIVDKHRRPVAPGTFGDIAVKSIYAPHSYDTDPGQSDSYFEGGVFYPGDQGQLGADGQLELLGRKRRFINVAGSKVDPVEIEVLLRDHPSVADAAVVGVPDGAGGEKIKAVVVLKFQSTEREIYEYCRSRAADFKCPRAIEFREKIPRSPMGKVLRAQLADQAPQQSSASHLA